MLCTLFPMSISQQNHTPTYSANRIPEYPPRDGILWGSSILDVKTRTWNANWKCLRSAYWGFLCDKFVIRSVNEVLRAHSSFIKYVEGSTPPPSPSYKVTMGPMYVSNRPYTFVTNIMKTIGWYFVLVYCFVSMVMTSFFFLSAAKVWCFLDVYWLFNG